MNRSERRKFDSDTRLLFAKIRDEHHATRKSGKWPPWNQSAVMPGEVGGGGWTLDIHTAFENSIYAVLIRTIDTTWGVVDHACISTLTGGDVAWRDKQRIKNELFGEDRTAIEVYPTTRDLCDGADAWHLWVLPPGFRLPFTIGAEGCRES
jgi:hypothetical protein